MSVVKTNNKSDIARQLVGVVVLRAAFVNGNCHWRHFQSQRDVKIVHLKKEPLHDEK